MIEGSGFFIVRNVEQQINAQEVSGGIHYHQHVKERVATFALTQQEIDRLRRVCVRFPEFDQAARWLAHRHVVALRGTAGSGRFITGVNLIADLGMSPHRLILDVEDLHRSLPEEESCGYLLDAQDITDQLGDTAKSVLGDAIKRLTALGNFVVIVTTTESWRRLGLAPDIPDVEVKTPAATEIFRSHLAYLRSAETADTWSMHTNVARALSRAQPRDAERLARLADAAMSTLSERDPIQEALAAYANWSDHLADWFKRTGDGYQRALLLAAAALDGINVETVFAAADKLAERVKLSRDPGGALVGEGVNELISSIEAELAFEGNVRFTRPDYAISVLDHVWADRPHLRADMALWLTGLPGIKRNPDSVQAGYALIELAIRQRDSDTLTTAAGTWANDPARRELAVDGLTVAGVSENIGRDIRRRLYKWATRATTDEGLQLTIAEVCGGPLGVSFPRIAFTRLRHLAIHGNSTVQAAVVKAFISLSAQPQLRTAVLTEIVRWAAGEDSDELRQPGVDIFIALCLLRDEDQLILLPKSIEADHRISELAAGWRVALRNTEQASAARDVAVGWLEAAAQKAESRSVVVAIITRACRNSFDIGILSPLIWKWARSSGQTAPISREEICSELLERISQKDPLATGSSLVPRYASPEQES